MMLCLLSGGKVEGGVRVGGGGGYVKVKAMEERGGGGFHAARPLLILVGSQNASSYLFRNVRSLLPAKETKKKKEIKTNLEISHLFPPLFNSASPGVVKKKSTSRPSFFPSFLPSSLLLLKKREKKKKKKRILRD